MSIYEAIQRGPDRRLLGDLLNHGDADQLVAVGWGGGDTEARASTHRLILGALAFGTA
jgi:hypothetical protein